MSRLPEGVPPAPAFRTEQRRLAGWLIVAGTMLAGFGLGWWLWLLPQRAPTTISAAAQPLAIATAGPASGAYPGDLAWDFKLPALAGGEVTLSEHRGSSAGQGGHRVLLNFFASWCDACRAEMPGVQAQAAKHAQHDWVVLGVDIMEGPEAVQAFQKEFGLTFPIALDGHGWVSRTYAITGTPTSLFIDRAGTIVARRLGYMSEADIAEMIAGVP